jgi:hypothetical protein
LAKGFVPFEAGENSGLKKHSVFCVLWGNC